MSQVETTAEALTRLEHGVTRAMSPRERQAFSGERAPLCNEPPIVLVALVCQSAPNLHRRIASSDNVTEWLCEICDRVADDRCDGRGCGRGEPYIARAVHSPGCGVR